MKKVLLFTFTLLTIFSFKLEDTRTTIFLCGDSTMADKAANAAPETGWGMVLPEFFTNEIKIENHAVNGRSTKSFINEGRWKTVIDKVKKGDWVLIQFGHNDQKVNDTTRSAPSQTLYKQNLTRFVNETRAKGGTPVLITPVMRRKFDEGGKFVDQHQDYPDVVKALAKELKVPMIDLHQKSQKVIEQHGVAGSKKLFLHYPKNVYARYKDGASDDTHFSRYGAEVMASLVCEDMASLGLPLKSYFKKSVYPTKFVYELPKVSTPVFKKDTFNIVNFGAVADGQTLNTKAINKAIVTCSEAGGGTVIVPSGVWLTGSIVMKSNVNLHLRKGALIQFSNRFEDFDLIRTTYEGLTAARCQAPVYGIDLENVAITGFGVLDGAGDAWRPVKRSKMTQGAWEKLIASGGLLSPDKNNWYPSQKSYLGSTVQLPGVLKDGKEVKDFEYIKDFLRPNMLSLTRCSNVLLEGITFQNSPAWCLHPLLCDNITLKGVKAKNPWYAQNGDGIDLESCKNALIEDCTFDVGDDGICIKSGRDEEGRKRGVPTENVLINNCFVYHAHGGFVIGSEMSGGVKNMFVNNCTFMGTDIGLRFKSARGRGGVVENIYISDIGMTNIPGEAILFDMYYAAKDPVPVYGEKTDIPEIKFEPVGAGTPLFKDFYMKNIVCRGAEKALFIRGLPEMPIKNVWLEDAILESDKGMICTEAENINLKNVSILSKDATTIQIQNGQQITLDNIQYKGASTDLLLKITGERNKSVRLVNTDTTQAKKDFELGEKVPSSVLLKK